MKKMIVIALCLVANLSFGNTNSLDEVAKILYQMTNSWHKLTYDPNSTATRLMCQKCGTSYGLLSSGKVVKVGRSKMKCRRCGCTVWYVDECMVLNFHLTRSRNILSISGKGFYQAIARGDRKEAEKWLSWIEKERDEIVKLKARYELCLELKKRR